ncbi:hypothetical protein [Cupriavidus sp. Marseille-Q8015]
MPRQHDFARYYSASSTSPTQSLHLPVSDEPRLRRMLDALMGRPGDGPTVAHWPAALAMSERTGL